MSRTSQVLVAAAALAALAGCAASPPAGSSTQTTPARNTAIACAQLAAMDAVVLTYPGADPDSPPPTADVLKEWAAIMAAPFGAVAANIPPELDASVATLRTVLDGVAQGNPLNSEDQAISSASVALDKWGHESCGFTPLDVTGSSTELLGVPATVPSGPVAVSFDNGGAPDKGGFVLLVARVHDGATYSLDAVRHNAIDIQQIADIVAVVQPTDSVGYSTVQLTAGRYLLTSPIGVPPSFTGVAVAEFDVAELNTEEGPHSP